MDEMPEFAQVTVSYSDIAETLYVTEIFLRFSGHGEASVEGESVMPYARLITP
jgi:hypothetical protein